MPSIKSCSWFLAAPLVLLSSCSRSPLGPSQLSAASGGVSGSAMVTLYSGTQLAPASPSVRLAMLSPDGSRSEAWTAQGAYAGQPVAVFSGLSEAGTYRFGVADQASRAPQWTSFTLAPGAQGLALPLQMSGSALTVADQVAAQANDYDFVAGSWHYVVAWSNPTALQEDLVLDIDPATLPPAWTYTFNPPVLLAGQTSVLTVSYPEASLTPTVQLALRGRAGSRLIGLASKGLSRHWTMDLLASFSNYTPLKNSPHTVNAPWDAAVDIGVQVVGTQLPVGAFATVRLPYENAPSKLLNFAGSACGWDDAVTQRDSGGVPVLLNSGSDTLLNHPIRSWYNSGWTLFENAQCISGAYGDSETFIFNVHLGNSDLSFQKTFLWPWN